MSNNWPIVPNLSIKGLTYRQRYVDYDPLSDECIARGRTHDCLLSISNLIEVEPYGRQDYEFDGIEYLRSPEALSSYGTCNGHETQSLLCVHAVNKIVLTQINEKIRMASPNLPNRYFVSEEERNLEKQRYPKAKGGK